MATQRELIRAQRAESFARARVRGVNIDDFRKENRTVVAMLDQAQKLINDGIQRPTRHQTVFDVPLLGTYDGVNRTFELSEDAASELNVEIGFMHASPPMFERLTHTDAGAPSVGSVRIELPRTIIVGEAPGVTDKLVGFYIKAR